MFQTQVRRETSCLLRDAERPSKPMPRSSSVPGSGTVVDATHFPELVSKLPEASEISTASGSGKSVTRSPAVFSARDPPAPSKYAGGLTSVLKSIAAPDDKPRPISARPNVTPSPLNVNAIIAVSGTWKSACPSPPANALLGSVNEPVNPLFPTQV